MDARGYHEPYEILSPEVREVHRALVSLIEELEAVDWYCQRADATQDTDLRAVVLHNRDEEIEHAAMTLEWLRRRVPEFDRELRQYLFTTESIAGVEAGADAAATTPEVNGGSLGLGGLRKGEQ